LRVVDRRRWIASAAYFDILALAVLLVAGGGLAMQIFATGQNAVEPLHPGAQARVVMLAGVFMMAFAWVATRLVAAGFREAAIVRRG
jgi:hypothetical protein